MIGSIMLAELVKSQGISVIDESALPIIGLFRLGKHVSFFRIFVGAEFYTVLLFSIERP